MTERQGRSAAADDHCSRGSEARPSVLIVGCSGHARVVIDIVELEGKYRVVGLIDSFKHSALDSSAMK